MSYLFKSSVISPSQITSLNVNYTVTEYYYFWICRYFWIVYLVQVLAAGSPLHGENPGYL